MGVLSAVIDFVLCHKFSDEAKYKDHSRRKIVFCCQMIWRIMTQKRKLPINFLLKIDNLKVGSEKRMWKIFWRIEIKVFQFLGLKIVLIPV